jgi:hypothetical protein
MRLRRRGCAQRGGGRSAAPPPHRERRQAHQRREEQQQHLSLDEDRDAPPDVGTEHPRGAEDQRDAQAQVPRSRVLERCEGARAGDDQQ